MLEKREHGKKEDSSDDGFQVTFLYSKKKVITERLAQIIVHEFFWDFKQIVQMFVTS